MAWSEKARKAAAEARRRGAVVQKHAYGTLYVPASPLKPSTQKLLAVSRSHRLNLTLDQRASLAKTLRLSRSIAGGKAQRKKLQQISSQPKYYTGGRGLKEGTRQQLAVARLNKQLTPAQRHEMAKTALDIRAFTRGKTQPFGSVRVIKK